MATEKQISSIYQNWQRYRIIWANVHDSTVNFKNADWSINYWSMTTNQESDSTVNLPIPTVDSALSSTSENPVQNKKVKEALDTKITNPSWWNAWQVLKKTDNWEEWADESWWWWDEIVYLTQDEYDALSPAEKMNGTHYGIVWDWVSDVLTTAEMTSLARFIHWWWTTIDLAWESINWSTWKIYEIPSDCNIIYINVEFKTSSNYYCLSWSYLFTRWLDYRQFWADLFGSSSNKWFTAEVDWDSFELKLRSNDSSDSIYTWHITYC